MKRAAEKIEELDLDPEIAEAIGNFRQNVTAWTEAVAARPRTATAGVRRLSWRLALGAALGCLIVAASVAGVRAHRWGQTQARQQVAPAAGVPTVEHQQTAALVATDEVNEQAEEAARDVASVEAMLANQDAQDELADGRVGSDEQLLAAVDRDLKRQVPSVMEPLVQLAEDGSME